MALRTTTAIVVASIAITLAVIQSGGLRLEVMEAQGAGRIAFKSDRDGDSEIYVMDADGSNQVNLTNNSAADSIPSWSPDGSKIAFTSTRDGNCGPLCEEFYVMGADGSNQTRLTNNGERETSASWSPDGTKIAFISTRSGQSTFDAWVMDADGGNPTRLTTNLDVNSVRWFPGASIAFNSNADGDFEIHLIEADGSNLRTLTVDIATDLDPALSAQGKIAFISDRDGPGGPLEVYVMDVDGSNVTRLTNNSAGERWPSWEPVSAATPVPSLNLLALIGLGGLMGAVLAWKLKRTRPLLGP